MKHNLGILDSGIGGLTFVKAMMSQRLDVDISYASDPVNVPYGDKSQDFMKQRIEIMVESLLERNVEAILIACNTATAETITQIREKFTIPFIGIEPFLKHPHLFPDEKHRKYALILTPATQASERFKNLQLKNDPDGLIDVYALPHLALHIEALKNRFFSEVEFDICEDLLPLKSKGYTHIILGCTHYSILDKWMSRYMKADIVDPTNHVIEHVKKTFLLEELEEVEENHHFWYSDTCGKTWHPRQLTDFSFFRPGFIGK